MAEQYSFVSYFESFFPLNTVLNPQSHHWSVSMHFLMYLQMLLEYETNSFDRVYALLGQSLPPLAPLQNEICEENQKVLSALSLPSLSLSWMCLCVLFTHELHFNRQKTRISARKVTDMNFCQNLPAWSFEWHQFYSNLFEFEFTVSFITRYSHSRLRYSWFPFQFHRVVVKACL